MLKPALLTVIHAVLCGVLLLTALPAKVAAQQKAEIVVNQPHSNSLRSMALSKDGKRLLTGSDDKTIKVWDAETGLLIRTFRGHADRVDAVAYGSDLTKFVSASMDKTVRLWDVATGRIIRTFEGHTSWVHAVALSSDGSRIVSGGTDKTIKVWQPDRGQALHTIQTPGGSVHAAAFSPDGTTFATGGTDRVLRLWSTSTAQLARSFAGHEGGIFAVAFSPDGSLLASGGSDRSVKIWSVADGRPVLSILEKGTVASIDFSPDGRLLLVGIGESDAPKPTTLKIWSVGSGALQKTFELNDVRSAFFSPDGTHVLANGENKPLRLNVQTGKPTGEFAPSNGVRSVAVGASGRHFVSASADGSLYFWHGGGGLANAVVGHPKKINSINISRDEKFMASGSDDKTIKVWDAATGKLLREIKDTAEIWSVAFSPDGKLIMSGSSDNLAKTWDTSTGRLVRTLPRHGDTVWCVSFSPDGKLALSSSGTELGSGDNSIRIWEVQSGRLIQKLGGTAALDDTSHIGMVTAASFSPNAKLILSAGNDGKLKIWDAVSRKLLRTIAAHEGHIYAAVFSQNGNQFASAGEDGKVAVWDAASFALVRTYSGHSGGVTSVAFSADGTRLISGGWDSRTNIWDVKSGQILVTLVGAKDGRSIGITPAGFFSETRAVIPQWLDQAGDLGGLLSLVRGMDASTIDQIRQSLFNPDLVREYLQGDLQDEVKSAAKVLDLDKVLGSQPSPTVRFLGANLSETRQEVVDFEVLVRDEGKGVGRVEWRVNGVTTSVLAKPSGRGPDYRIPMRLALDPGDNAIEVVAYNGMNLLASLPARTTIKFTGAADATKPKLHVLSIGINTYVDRGWRPIGSADLLAFPPLGLAVKDATTFGERLKRAGGGLYADVRLTMLTDAQATRDGIRAAIDKIAAEVHPRDTFILFAAAHGKSEAGRFYLIPQEYDGGANPEALTARAIDQSMLQDWLANRIKAKKALILLDTCESGALVGGHARSRTDAPTSEAALGRLHEATGRPVLTAAADGKPAFEGYEGHGVFTWALLDALKNGDRNGNGTIELSELVAHVQDQVPKIAAKLSGRGVTAIAVRGSTGDAQSARFGSIGEDFALAQRLQ